MNHYQNLLGHQVYKVCIKKFKKKGEIVRFHSHDRELKLFWAFQLLPAIVNPLQSYYTTIFQLIFNRKIYMCRKKTAPCPFLTQIKSPNITSGQAYAQPKYPPAQKWSGEVSQSILRLPRGMLVLSKPQQKERLSYKN